MFLKIPDKLKDKKIKLIEICPIYEGHQYKINYVYEKEKIIDNVKNEKYMSIDLGIVNLMTIHDPDGFQYIIKGGKLISINKYFNKKIDDSRSFIKNKYDKDTCKKIRNLLIKRKNVLDHYFTMIVNWLYKKYKNKEKIIIGYNEGWKTNVNMRNIMNRKFYEIPFTLLIKKIKDKFTGNDRINIINEAYTSKTDSLNLEEVCRHGRYDGSRIKRGLFSSKTGKIINADINGAINIMRKYYKQKGIHYEEVKGIGLLNPINVDGKEIL
jgi:putative transposase